MVSFDALASSLLSDARRAQVLLEVGPGRDRLDQARAILLLDGEQGIDIERINQEEPAVFLVRTSPERARRLVIALTENGFTRLKSIYPSRSGGKAAEPAESQELGRR